MGYVARVLNPRRIFAVLAAAALAVACNTAELSTPQIDSGAGCVVDSDCAAGSSCVFIIADHCLAAPSCVNLHCDSGTCNAPPAPILACSCNGETFTFDNPGASTYAPKAVQSLGACPGYEGGLLDAGGGGSDASDATSPVTDSAPASDSAPAADAAPSDAAPSDAGGG
jgi:hypothetical protein